MTLGSHQRTIGKSQVHITPKWIIDALGPFDLDPAAASSRPWDCATHSWPTHGLQWDWPKEAFVWLNPPFHRYEVERWMTKLADHNNGIALLHARTETAWFRVCWSHASAMLFLSQRLIFCKPDGTQQTTLKGEVANSGAPPVLVAFGERAKAKLIGCRFPGILVEHWRIRT